MTTKRFIQDCLLLNVLKLKPGRQESQKYTYLQFHAEKDVKEKRKERTKRISDPSGIPSVSKQAAVSTIKPMTPPSSKARKKVHRPKMECMNKMASSADGHGLLGSITRSKQ